MAQLATVRPAIVRSFTPSPAPASSPPGARALGRVNFRSGVPRYLQVKRILSDAIRQGLYPPGVKLPNTDCLSEQFGVSLITAHRALLSLAGEGLVTRQRGRGTFVREKHALDAATSKRTRLSLVINEGRLASHPDVTALLEGLRNAAGDAFETAVVLHQPGGIQWHEFAGCDGVIAIKPSIGEFTHLEALARELPVLLLASGPGRTALPCVDSRNVEGARSAVRHLVDLGHDTIALLGGPSSFTAHVQQREGFLDSAREYGLPEARAVVLNAEGVASFCSGQALKCLMSRRDRPTGVIASSYDVALDALVLFRQIGLRVPDDVSVVAFDDARCATLLDPPLTTVVRPLETMAQSACRRMLELIDGRMPQPQTELLPCFLVVRGSTAPPP